MTDTPIYTFSHHNGEHTTVALEHGEHVSLRAASVIVHRVDENGRRTGRTVFPYASMKSYHVEYPDTCDQHGSLTACKAQSKHSDEAPMFRVGGPTDQYGAPVSVEEEARTQQRTRDHALFIEQMRSSGMCIGPWHDGQCLVQPVIHPQHGYISVADQGPTTAAEQIAKTIQEVSNDDTEHVLRIIGERQEQRRPYRPERHVLDIVGPRDPDEAWPRYGGSEVGGLGDVPERGSVDVERPVGDPPVGPE